MTSRAWVFAGTASQPNYLRLSVGLQTYCSYLPIIRFTVCWNTLCYFERCESIVYHGLYPSCRPTSCKFDLVIDSAYEDFILNLWTNWRNRKRNLPKVSDPRTSHSRTSLSAMAKVDDYDADKLGLWCRFGDQNRDRERPACILRLERS